MGRTAKVPSNERSRTQTQRKTRPREEENYDQINSRLAGSGPVEAETRREEERARNGQANSSKSPR